MTDAEFMLAYVARERKRVTDFSTEWSCVRNPELDALGALAKIACEKVLLGYGPRDGCTCDVCSARRKFRAKFRAEMEGKDAR